MKDDVVSEVQVSVIVTVYNVAGYLKECLDTIVNQTLKNIEIICIDDCSTDESYDILQEFAAKDKRIIALKNPRNLGAGPTRNIGIQVAKGEYLAILDGDDYFELDMLKIMYEKCKRVDADIGICNTTWCDEKSGTKKKYEDFSDKDLAMFQPFFAMADIPERVFTQFLEVPFNKLYKREWLLNENITFQNLYNSNDVFFGQMTIATAERIVHINKYLIFYRYNRPHQTSSNRKQHPLCSYEAFAKIYLFLHRYDVYELYKTSFHDMVAGGIIHALEFVDGELKNEVIKFWKEVGLPSFNMVDLRSNEFFNEGAYNCYKKLSYMDYKSVDWNILETKVKKICGCIEKLKQERKKFKLTEKKITFPYFLFPISSKMYKIIICGGGEVGEQFYRMFTSRKNTEVIAIVDKNEEKIKSTNINVQEIDAIKQLSYDIIILATLEKNTAKKMKQYILDMGIAEEKIYWGGQYYLEEESNNLYCKMLNKLMT